MSLPLEVVTAAANLAKTLAIAYVLDRRTQQRVRLAYERAAEAVIAECEGRGYQPKSAVWNELVNILGNDSKLIALITRLRRGVIGDVRPDPLADVSTEVRALADYFVGDLNERASETLPIQSRLMVDILATRMTRLEDMIARLTPTPERPLDRLALTASLRRASAVLRHSKNDIAGIHIERQESRDIFEWLMADSSVRQVGVVADVAGMGKTGLMRDLLEMVDEAGVPVWGIKADSLAGVRSLQQLANEQLGVSESIDDCIRFLAADGPIVVLIDQLDALSLALTRDQLTLDLMIELIALLRGVNNVRVLASCRTFDLHNDPRLSRIQIDRTFPLRLLDELEVGRILENLGVDTMDLLPSHQQSLRVPLHLEIYSRVIRYGTASRPGESYRSLQQLYDVLWEGQVSRVPPERPNVNDRVSAINRMVERMRYDRVTAVPAAILDDLDEAATYLKQMDFIRQEGSLVHFSHQTLLDYCYARRFVAEGRSISRDVLDGPQGLFERSQTVQVLAYLRGTDVSEFSRSLRRLLDSDELRVHMRLLLLGWFGSLSDITEHDLVIARHVLRDRAKSLEFLRAAHGNALWFEMFRDYLALLEGEGDEQLCDGVAYFLQSVINIRSDEVVGLLNQYLARDDLWKARISLCLSELENWQLPGAVQLLIDLLSRGQGGMWAMAGLERLADSNPAGACGAIRAHFDWRLEVMLAKVGNPGQQVDGGTDEGFRMSGWEWEEEIFGEHAAQGALEKVVRQCPEVALGHLLPWFTRALGSMSRADVTAEDYAWDQVFASGWYGEHIGKGPSFALRIAEALGDVARRNPARFRELGIELAGSDFLAAHRVLAEGYLASPEEYAREIVDYLAADSRRLSLGEPNEDSHYESCLLFGAAFKYVDQSLRAGLEKLIRDYRPESERRQPRRAGLTRLRFLAEVPRDLLSEPARRDLDELQRKFPGYQQRKPRGITGGWVQAPISDDAQEKMSNVAWLGAIRKYDDSTIWGGRHEAIDAGGVVELSRALARRTVDNPRRFYALARDQFDESVSVHYLEAVISGLADSEAEAEMVFDLIRRFSGRLVGSTRRGICRSLSKRAKDGVPDDLLNLIRDWAVSDPDPVEEAWKRKADDGTPYYGGDALFAGINTNRGAATLTFGECGLARNPPLVLQVLDFMERMALDASTGVRTCVVSLLPALLAEDDVRAVKVFGLAIRDDQAALATPVSEKFLYWALAKHFARIRGFIEKLLHSDEDDARQAGARLSCLSAFEHLDARSLAEQAMRNDKQTRVGAAQVYARNLENRRVEADCEQALRQLWFDSDTEVRAASSVCFRHLRPQHLGRFSSLFQTFVQSPALLDGAEHFVGYLAPLATDVQLLALDTVERLLNEVGQDIASIRTAHAALDMDLVRILLTVYHHADDDILESRAIDLFERMLLHGSWQASRALAEWDRR